MLKKNRQTLYIKLFFVAFFFIGFLYLYISTNFISAASLEVDYPRISGQDINEGVLTLPSYVKYLFNFGIFIGVCATFLSLAIAGSMYLLSPAIPGAGLLSKARDQASGAISGLLILVLTYLILVTISPSLSILTVQNLPNIPPAAEKPKKPGVYFNKTNGCTDLMPKYLTSSTADLGNFKNKVNSIDIVQGSIGYVSILYDTIDFQGMCKYIPPNDRCQSVKPFGASASVHKYDFKPNGDGVYFYRKTYFNEQGGFYKVDNAEIRGSYMKKLENLKFNNVPEEEQDCIKYENNGECAKDGRRKPSLAGTNISSIKINGDYLVLFIYFAPGDPEAGPWSYCQAFPTIDDQNKKGPYQIKWESIRNKAIGLPNYVYILPIKR